MGDWTDGWERVGSGSVAFLVGVIVGIALIGVAVGVCIGAAIWA
jgi:hypothetical protein